MNWENHIISNAGILGGKPIIKGTRLSVELILERLADGWTETMLLEAYPTLYKEALQAVYALSLENMKETSFHDLKTA